MGLGVDFRRYVLILRDLNHCAEIWNRIVHLEFILFFEGSTDLDFLSKGIFLMGFGMLRFQFSVGI